MTADEKEMPLSRGTSWMFQEILRVPRWTNNRLLSSYLLSVTILIIILSSSFQEGDGASLSPIGKHKSSRDRGCYYMLQHYKNGQQIKTDEPCLNCTCENSMLMCYLRVCPYVKPVGDRCIIERVNGECCPRIICPETGPPPDSIEQEVEPETSQPLSTTTTTSDSAQSTTPTSEPRASTTNQNSLISSEVTFTNSSDGSSSGAGCMLAGNYYHEGAQMPSDPSKPCEVCYCIRNSSACVMQDCALEVSGCAPIYNAGGCCPTRYNCSAENAFTTPRPGFGSSSKRRFWESLPERFGFSNSEGIYNVKSPVSSTTSTASPLALPDFGRSPSSKGPGCKAPNSTRVFADGERVPSKNKCEHCYCMRSEIVCAVQECRPPCDGCVPIIDADDQCCPKRYECAAPTQRVPPDNIIDTQEFSFSTTTSDQQQKSNTTQVGSDLAPEPSTSAPGSASRTSDDNISSSTSPQPSTTTPSTEVSSSGSSSMENANSSPSMATTSATDLSKQEISVMTTRQTKPPLKPISPKLSTNEEEGSSEMATTDENSSPSDPKTMKPGNVDGFNLQDEREQEGDSVKTGGRIEAPEGSLAGGQPAADANEVVPPSLTSTIPPQIITSSADASNPTMMSNEQSVSSLSTVGDSQNLVSNERKSRPLVVPSTIPGEGSCRYNGRIYENGEEVKSRHNCTEICMCINSVVYCDEVDCPRGPDDQEKCQKVMVEGQCCPKYICPGEGTTTSPPSSTETKVHEATGTSEVESSTTSKPIESTNDANVFSSTNEPGRFGESSSTTGMSSVDESKIKGATESNTTPVVAYGSPETTPAPTTTSTQQPPEIAQPVESTSSSTTNQQEASSELPPTTTNNSPLSSSEQPTSVVVPSTELREPSTSVSNEVPSDLAKTSSGSDTVLNQSDISTTTSSAPAYPSTTDRASESSSSPSSAGEPSPSTSAPPPMDTKIESGTLEPVTTTTPPQVLVTSTTTSLPVEMRAQAGDSRASESSSSPSSAGELTSSTSAPPVEDTVPITTTFPPQPVVTSTTTSLPVEMSAQAGDSSVSDQSTRGQDVSTLSPTTIPPEQTSSSQPEASASTESSTAMVVESTTSAKPSGEPVVNQETATPTVKPTDNIIVEGREEVSPPSGADGSNQIQDAVGSDVKPAANPELMAVPTTPAPSTLQDSSTVMPGVSSHPESSPQPSKPVEQSPGTTESVKSSSLDTIISMDDATNSSTISSDSPPTTISIIDTSTSSELSSTSQPASGQSSPSIEMTGPVVVSSAPGVSSPDLRGASHFGLEENLASTVSMVAESSTPVEATTTPTSTTFASESTQTPAPPITSTQFLEPARAADTVANSTTSTQQQTSTESPATITTVVVPSEQPTIASVPPSADSRDSSTVVTSEVPSDANKVSSPIDANVIQTEPKTTLPPAPIDSSTTMVLSESDTSPPREAGSAPSSPPVAVADTRIESGPVVTEPVPTTTTSTTSPKVDILASSTSQPTVVSNTEPVIENNSVNESARGQDASTSPPTTTTTTTPQVDIISTSQPIASVATNNRPAIEENQVSRNQDASNSPSITSTTTSPQIDAVSSKITPTVGIYTEPATGDMNKIGESEGTQPAFTTLPPVSNAPESSSSPVDAKIEPGNVISVAEPTTTTTPQTQNVDAAQTASGPQIGTEQSKIADQFGRDQVTSVSPPVANIVDQTSVTPIDLTAPSQSSNASPMESTSSVQSPSDVVVNQETSTSTIKPIDNVIVMSRDEMSGTSSSVPDSGNQILESSNSSSSRPESAAMTTTPTPSTSEQSTSPVGSLGAKSSPQQSIPIEESVSSTTSVSQDVPTTYSSSEDLASSTSPTTESNTGQEVSGTSEPASSPENIGMSSPTISSLPVDESKIKGATESNTTPVVAYGSPETTPAPTTTSTQQPPEIAQPVESTSSSTTNQQEASSELPPTTTNNSPLSSSEQPTSVVVPSTELREPSTSVSNEVPSDLAKTSSGSDTVLNQSDISTTTSSAPAYPSTTDRASESSSSPSSAAEPSPSTSAPPPMDTKIESGTLEPVTTTTPPQVLVTSTTTLLPVEMRAEAGDSSVSDQSTSGQDVSTLSPTTIPPEQTSSSQPEASASTESSTAMVVESTTSAKPSGEPVVNQETATPTVKPTDNIIVEGREEVSPPSGADGSNQIQDAVGSDVKPAANPELMAVPTTPAPSTLQDSSTVMPGVSSHPESSPQPSKPVEQSPGISNSVTMMSSTITTISPTVIPTTVSIIDTTPIITSDSSSTSQSSTGQSASPVEVTTPPVTSSSADISSSTSADTTSPVGSSESVAKSGMKDLPVVSTDSVVARSSTPVEATTTPTSTTFASESTQTPAPPITSTQFLEPARAADTVANSTTSTQQQTSTESPATITTVVVPSEQPTIASVPPSADSRDSSTVVTSEVPSDANKVSSPIDANVIQTEPKTTLPPAPIDSSTTMVLSESDTSPPREAGSAPSSSPLPESNTKIESESTSTASTWKPQVDIVTSTSQPIETFASSSGPVMDSSLVDQSNKSQELSTSPPASYVPDQATSTSSHSNGISHGTTSAPIELSSSAEPGSEVVVNQETTTTTSKPTDNIITTVRNDSVDSAAPVGTNQVLDQSSSRANSDVASELPGAPTTPTPPVSQDLSTVVPAIFSQSESSSQPSQPIEQSPGTNESIKMAALPAEEQTITTTKPPAALSTISSLISPPSMTSSESSTSPQPTDGQTSSPVYSTTAQSFVTDTGSSPALNNENSAEASPQPAVSESDTSGPPKDVSEPSLVKSNDQTDSAPVVTEQSLISSSPSEVEISGNSDQPSSSVAYDISTPDTTTIAPLASNVTVSPGDAFIASVTTGKSVDFQPVNLTTVIPSIRGTAASITIPWNDISNNTTSGGTSGSGLGFSGTSTSQSLAPEPLSSTPSSASPTESDYEEITEESGCEYENKTYSSAQQIPRSHPCDFCFCFRGDIICLQQTCPPPVPHCFETIIDGFCCPRYECPVHTVRASTNSTSLSLTPYETHSRLHTHTHEAEKSNPGKTASNIRGCFVDNKLYGVGQVIESASGPCLECRCDRSGMMKCNPKECTPEDPLLQQINREVLQSTLSRSQVR